jgi:hypothetical protein
VVETAVRVLDSTATAKQLFRPWLDMEVAEECVELRLEQDAPGFGSDLIADDRDGVDLGDVPLVAFLGGGTYETSRGSREVVNETIVARVGAAVVEASFTAAKSGFPEFARAVERALRRVVRDARRQPAPAGMQASPS